MSKESSFDKINNKNRRADDSKRASSTTGFSNNGGDDKKQQQVKKWKTKRAGAKERRILHIAFFTTLESVDGTGAREDVQNGVTTSEGEIWWRRICKTKRIRGHLR